MSVTPQSGVTFSVEKVMRQLSRDEVSFLSFSTGRTARLLSAEASRLKTKEMELRPLVTHFIPV